MTEYWYNYRTNEFEEFTKTPIDFHDFIPQQAPAQNMLNLLIETGVSPEFAALRVLLLYVQPGLKPDRREEAR